MYLTTRVEALAAERDPKIAVPELKTLLDGATQDISHAGQRVFRHPAAQGHASLDSLAKSYFSAPLTDDSPLDVRLMHDALAPQLVNAYVQSNVVASKTWAGVLTGLRELSFGCPCCSGVMVAVVGTRLGDDWEENLSFGFSKERFAQLWPSEQPYGTTSTYDQATGRATHTWTASRAMVEQAAQAERLAAEGSATPTQAAAKDEQI